MSSATPTHRYTRVWAWTNLPDSYYIYEAQCNLQCAQCGATIPVNSYFARKFVHGKRDPLPHCRECQPFNMYTSSYKITIAPRESEYLYVSEV